MPGWGSSFRVNQDPHKLKDILIKMLKKINFNQEDFNKVINSKFYCHLKYLLKNN